MADRARAGVTLVVCIAAIFCSLTIAIAQWRYAIFRADVDLGIFTQVIGGAAHGFSSTVEGRINHLLVHWSPIIVLGWPFVRIFGPPGLEYFQAFLISLTIFPVWGLARARFPVPGAVAVVAVAALYPILCANAVGDFHEMAFVPVLSATLVYALDRRCLALGVVAAVLLACTKEDQFVALAFNGLAIAATSRRDAFDRRLGLCAVVVAAGMAVVYFGIVRNVLQPHVAYGALHFYNWHQATASSRTHWVLPRVRYVLQILAPLAFLPLISRYGLFLIPGFVEVLASHEPVTIAPGAHYSALLSGYALAAFVDALGRIAAIRLRVAAAAAAAAVSILIAIFASPMEYWYYLYRLPNAHDARLQRTLDALPRDAAVGSEDEIFAHLGLNPNASIDLAGSALIVFDRSHYGYHWRFVDEPIVRGLLRRHQYAVQSDDDGIVVLRRL